MSSRARIGLYAILRFRGYLSFPFLSFSFVYFSLNVLPALFGGGSFRLLSWWRDVIISHHFRSWRRARGLSFLPPPQLLHLISSLGVTPACPTTVDMFLYRSPQHFYLRRVRSETTDALGPPRWRCGSRRRGPASGGSGRCYRRS